MTDEKEHDESDLRHMAGYVSVVRDALRMQNWDIIVHRTIYGDEDAWAHTWQVQNHFTTNVEFGTAIFQEKPEVVRSVIVHELIHAQHRDVNEVWEGCTLGNDDVPQSQSKSWDADFRMHMERFVSWITRMIEDTVPVYDPKAKYETGIGVHLHGEHRA